MLLLFALLALQQTDLARGLEQLRAGRLAEAESALARAAEADPESADAHFYLGVARFRAGNPSGAVPVLVRACELAPKRAAIWKALAAARSAMGDLAGAEVPFRTACELDPRSELACYYYGRNLHAQNRFAEAVPVFRKALSAERDQNLWLVWRGLALALEADGEAGAAERAFEEAIRRLPPRVAEQEDPRLDYGAFLFRQGRASEALRQLEPAAGAHPGAAGPRFLLGRVLAQTGQLEPAARRLEEAVRIDPKLAGAHLLLGQVYMRLGRAGDAARHLKLGREQAVESQ